MNTKFYLFVFVNIILQAVAAPGWTWEDEDPYFVTSEKPTKPPRPPTPTMPMTPSTPSTPSNPTIDAKYKRCVRMCPSTNEYNPICGTDNITYGNDGKLLCAKQCGAKTDKLHDGVCNRVTTTGRTTTTITTTASSVVTPEPVCYKRCPKTGEYNPLCGTNGVTYQNDSRMRCAQQCGVNVQKSYNGQCARPTVSTSTTKPPTRITTLPPNFRACIRQCIVSSQYQPVCANDGTTYRNESEMTCDISCGRPIQKMRDGAC